ncbi:hypothetical protein KP79_PYT07195 [Mizuhopecten yessoensis]|uniref:Uncharacterized protein n=1 Tax=Mizuhopecten yessoensis TaxID=6573 RepID=A0A210Q239_MIZYE|nr:hypothetical protein KP79_PYT07195 [Mizuhopecten yessoensis]
MGPEDGNTLSNGILLAERNTLFLQLWLKEYDNYNPDNWGYNALIVPFELSQKHPEMIHIERDKLVNPTYNCRHQIFKMNFDWSENYTIHLYIRRFKSVFDILSFRTMNNTLGAVTRYLLFGHKELCSA